jgi:hypothetical protein
MTIQIPLTQGRVAIVDDEDADLAKRKWHFSRGYAERARYVGQKRFHVSLHRVVLARKLARPLEPGEVTDHINGDTLDNRRENLRVCTHRQNLLNAGPRRPGKRYKGAGWHKRRGKWQAYITVRGKLKWLGYFDTEEAAAHAYDEAARKHHGEFAYLNFPD